jgi:hypothetical protein
MKINFYSAIKPQYSHVVTKIEQRSAEVTECTVLQNSVHVKLFFLACVRITSAV